MKRLGFCCSEFVDECLVPASVPRRSFVDVAGRIQEVVQKRGESRHEKRRVLGFRRGAVLISWNVLLEQCTNAFSW